MTGNIPFDFNAENSVIGAFLIEPKTLPYAMTKLTSQAFYDVRNAKLYDYLVSQQLKGRKIDMVTLIDGVKDGKEDLTNHVINIMEITVTSANIKQHIEILLKKQKQRHLLELAEEMKEMVENNVDISSITGVINETTKQMQAGISKGLKPLVEIIPTVYKTMDELAKNPNAFAGYSTGYSDLDRKLGGLRSSDLIILAGRPGTGKTSFALNVALNMCKIEKKNVAIYNMEMSKEQVTQKLMSLESQVGLLNINNGNLTEQEWQDLADGVGNMPLNNIFINDTPAIKISEIKLQCEQVEDLGLIVIDYLGLLKSERDYNNRVSEISEISRNLKILAKELNVPIIALSQMSRSIEQRVNKRPMMSDLRDSGSIEQDADSIIFSHREDNYDPEAQKDIVELIISKNRHGETGTVELKWVGQYTMFIGIYKE